MPFTAFAVISRNPLKIKKSTSLEVLIIFKWLWEMDCLAVLLAQNPHAHRFAMSNQMVRLHGISCLSRLSP